jgi:translation elongation factor aEF-1 beta
MGIAGVKIKIMPSSPEANLKNIEQEAEKIILKEGGKNCTFQREPIAFGLNAVIAFFAWQEEKELELLESKLEKIKEVNSVNLIDIRRAIG